MKLQLKRSNVIASGAAKIPTSAQLEYGELAINYNQQDPAIFLKDSNNNVIRIGGIGNIADDGQVELPTTTNPPTSPTPANGNLWYNSEDGRLYVYYVDTNSSQWVDASPDTWQTTVIPDTTNPAHQAGTLDDRYINTNGDTLTGALLLDSAATSTAPDLAFDGDSNTGIYSPGADKLSISTAGVQRVTVDSSGKVGIGVTPPNYGSGRNSLDIHSSGSTITHFGITNSTTGSGGASNGFNIIQNGLDTQLFLRESGFISFSTASTERLRIDSSGNVGIGTTSASAKLHIETNAADAAKLRLGFDSTRYYDIFRGSVTNGGLLNFYGSQSSFTGYVFGGVDGERMRIDSSGRLLVGTTTEGAANANTLTLGSTGSVGMTIRSGTSDYGSIFFSDATSGSGEYVGAIQYNHGSNFFTIGTNTAERMRIDSSGRLLVGTISAPAGTDAQYTKFAIRGNTLNDNACYFSLGNKKTTANTTSNDNLGIITFNDNDSDAGEYARIIGATDGTNGTNDYPGKLVFSTTADGGSSPTERLRIDSSGRLLVGTTTEGAAIADNLTVADSGHSGLTIRSGTANYGSLYFSDGTSGAAEYAGFVEYNHNGNYLGFGTGSTTRMRIDSSGNVGIGTTSAAALLHVSGSGTQAIRLENTAGTGNANLELKLPSHTLTVGVNSSSNFISDSTAKPFVLYQAGSEQLRIDSSGKVGIGTSSPVRTLHIHESSSSDNAYVHLTSATTGTTTSDGLSLFLYGSGGLKDGVLSLRETANLLFKTGDLERLRIDSSGNVIVGGTATSSTNAAYISQNGTYVSNRTAGTNDLWNGKLNGTVTSTINADGSIDTAGQVTGLGFTAPLTIDGQYAFRGTLNGSVTSQVNANGSATFAGNVTTARILAIGSSASSKVWSGYLSNTVGASTSFITADGSATFAGDIIIGEGGFANQDKTGLYLAAAAGFCNVYHSASASSSFLKFTKYDASASGNFVVKAEITDSGSASFAGAIEVGLNSVSVGSRFYRKTSSTGVGVLQIESDIGSTRRDQMYVDTQGSVYNRTGTYTSYSSDERLKKDIVDAPSQWEDIKNIRMRKFRYKVDSDDAQLQLGIIAQELEPVCPNLIIKKTANAQVSTESEGLIAEGEDVLNWKQSIVHLKALKALQEAMARIEELEAKVSALEAS